MMALQDWLRQPLYYLALRLDSIHRVDGVDWIDGGRS